MLIACLIAFAILVVAWLVLPYTAETTVEAKPVEKVAPSRDTITAS